MRNNTGKDTNLLPRYSSLFLVFLFFLGQFHLFAQDSSRIEWIKPVFNMSGGSLNPWDGPDRIMQTIITRIDSAKASVDLAIYDLEHPKIKEALVRAANRGVRVRIVTDNYNRTDSELLDPPMFKALMAAGIHTIDDDGDILYADETSINADLVNDGADMHHKFAVFDALTESKQDDYVWTGSTNLTMTGAYNTNNTIVIKDDEIAAAYLFEFEQMWGGSGDKPDHQRARFHKDKIAYHKQTFWIGDIKTELHFAPIDRNRTKPLVSERISEVIRSETDHSLYFSAFSITPSFSISQAIWEVSENPEINLKGVISKQFYGMYRNRDQLWAQEIARTGNRSVLPSNELRKLHHKTILIDGDYNSEEDEAIVITGSYNFSNNADVNNDENLLIVYSDEFARPYIDEFEGIHKRAKREAAPPTPEIPTDTTFRVYRVTDAEKIEVEIFPGFGYPVSLLGVRAPRFYWGADSMQYFANHAKQFVDEQLLGKRIELEGYQQTLPQYGGDVFATFKLVDMENPNAPKTDLNAKLIERGYAVMDDFLLFDDDREDYLTQLEQSARNQKLGMWKQPDRMWEIVARTSKEEPTVKEDLFPINVNVATVEELQVIKGIGPVTANRIVEYRKQNGLFTAPEQLEDVKGIGPKTLEKMLPFIVVE